MLGLRTPDTRYAVEAAQLEHTLIDWKRRLDTVQQVSAYMMLPFSFVEL